MDQRTELAALCIAANKLLQACEVVPNGSLSAEFVRETFKDSLPEAAQALQAAPEGWVLVPREPTEAMLEAGKTAHHEAEDRVSREAALGKDGMFLRANRVRHVYHAMLTAAPSPTAALQAGEGS